MRDALRTLDLRQCSHAGLAYDVWAPVELGDGKVEGDRRTEWLERVCKIAEDRDYAKAFARWKQSFVEDGVCQEVETTSRLLVGHGNPSGSDVGLTLHHAWGVPVIPGSALAGVLAHYVDAELAGGTEEQAQEPERARWRGPTYEEGVVVAPPGELYAGLFGSPEIADSPGSQGLVTFCDALYVPGSGGGRPLVEDVLTVHHKAYYGGYGAVPPTDHDDPNPVSFVGVGKEVRFLLALCGPAEWTEVAMHLLLQALAWRGVGGKTSAGCGRLRAVESTPPAMVAASGAGPGPERAAVPGEPALVGGPARGRRSEPGPTLKAFGEWLERHEAAGTHARDRLAGIEREWVARLVTLAVEERLEAGRWIRKAIKHRKLEEQGKALSRRVEAGEG